MATNIFNYLETMGWTFDHRLDGMRSPDGRFIPRVDIANLDPTFQQVYRDKKTADALAYAPGVSRVPGGPVGGSGVVDLTRQAQAASRNAPPRWNSYQKLAMRLNMAEGDSFGLDHCHIVEGANRVFIFVVKGDKALVLEDLPSLFPSDSLIGQFRLFQEVE